MNRFKATYCIIAVLLGTFCSAYHVISQVPFHASYEEEAKSKREYIALFTDRNMYAVNEVVYFSAFYRQAWESEQVPWSKVMYVELVTPSGSLVTNGKFRLDERGSSGFLLIPSNTLTGNYYLRSYTRWMQNFGPQTYCYTPLTIINPFKKEVLTEKNEPSGLVADLVTLNDPAVTCRTDKTSYSPGEEIQLEISPNASDDVFPGGYCLSVVHEGLLDTLHAQVNIIESEGGGDFSFNYLPEIRGVSISGSVVNLEDLSPASEARLHFSSLGEHPEYFGTLTDELGRFILTLPDRTGTRELFVACEPSEGNKREIRIDQDFTSDPIPFRTRQFTLSRSEEEAATRMAVNMQFSLAYEKGQTNPDPDSNQDSFVPFYGKATSTTRLDDFVKLPTMNEVFVNLVPDVFVFYNEGKPYLNIYSAFHNVSIFPPLVLIDNIPIFDHEAIFSIDPERIERIEVINEVYVRGGLMYGGIVIIHTRHRDMAAIELPEGSYFFDYQVFHSAYKPAHYSPAGRMPDTRNTLLWVDRISPDPEQRKKIQFQAASQSGEYHVLVRGVSAHGAIVYGMSKFTVE